MRHAQDQNPQRSRHASQPPSSVGRHVRLDVPEIDLSAEQHRRTYQVPTSSDRPNPAAFNPAAPRVSNTPHKQPNRPPKRKRSKVIKFFVAIVIIAIIAVTAMTWFAGSQSNPNLLPDGENVRVEVPEGSTTSEIATILYDKGVINNKDGFVRDAKFSHQDSSLKPGFYVFEGGESNQEVIDHLVAGPNSNDGALLIPEGYTLKQTAQAVEEAYEGRITEEEFISAAHNAQKFASQFPFVSQAYEDSLEGFLFPKTYEVISGYTADDVISQILTQYQRETTQLNYSYPESRGLDPYQVLILASIVEREASSDNQATVASVFYNRLAIDMALQSDATIAYVVGADPKPEDLRIESGFNTYLNKGLPPAPICSPGASSLEAVCNPAQTDYLYFYFKDNGQGGLDYYFSKTFEEHRQSIAD